MSKWWIIIGIILAVAIGAVLLLNLGPKDLVRIQIQTEKAKMEPITQVVTASGKIRPETEVKVAADVGGYIRKLTVEEGDHVDAGQLLVEIDPEIYQARVMESRAAEQTARANLTLSEASLARVDSEARRVRGLFAKDLTSRANLEKALADQAIAKAEVEAAQGRLLQARATLDKARKDMAKCTINAPISGTVIVLNKEAGERASGGDFREDIIMQVADLSSMEVEVEVGERDVVLISEGDAVDIEVDAYPGVTVPGTVKEIANAGVTRNQWTESEVTNFPVVIQVGQTERVLRPQMSATVKIRTDHKDQALTVPIQSVTLRRPSELKGGGGPDGGSDQPPAGKPAAGDGKAREAKADAAGAEAGADGGDAQAKAGDAVGKKDEDEAKEGDAKAKKGWKREQPVEVVFVVEDGRAVAKRVETGLSSDTRIEILDGIAAGAEVVSGPYRALSKDLKNGDVVRVGDLPGGPGGKGGRGQRGKARRH